MQIQARIIHLALLAAATWLVSSAAYGQSMLRDASVQFDRFVDAPLVGKLPAGTAVQVLKSEAGWAQIKAGEMTGWVRASAINGEGAKTATIAQIKSGRLEGNNILSTSGVRGVGVIQKNDGNDVATQNTASLRTQAQALDVQKKFSEAYTYHQEILKREPDNSTVQNLVCWHWLIQNQPLQARPYCKKAADLDKTDYSSRLNIGHTYLLENGADWEATALTSWREALLLMKTESDLAIGPFADFDLFIQNNWQAASAKQYRSWFATNWQMRK